MPQRDMYHDAVKQALINDGWTVTRDPYVITLGERRGFIDLAAERTLAAQRAEHRIAVEIKSFIGPSPMSDLGEAVGQYLLYKSWLARTDLERTLYLAIDTVVAVDVFGDPSACWWLMCKRQRISAWRD